MTTPQSPYFFVKNFNKYSNDYVYLVNMGYERCPTIFQFTNPFDVYRIYVVKSGSGSLTIDDTVYKVSAHDAFLIRPNQSVLKEADTLTPWEYCYFVFAGNLASKLIERTYFKDNKSLHNLGDSTLAQLITSGTQKSKTCNVPDFFGLEQLFCFLRHLTPATSDEDFSVSTKSMSHSERYFLAAQTYIDTHYYMPIQVDDICKTINVSRSYLFRIFEKHAGSSITDYLTNVRINHAKTLLLTTEHSTSTIAHSVGYVNSTSFYRMFKRIEKVTPSEWRSSQRNSIL